MATCEVCGKSFHNQRSTARYCSVNCRKKASRRSIAARKRAEALTMTLEGQALVKKLHKVLPDTAKRVEAFIETHGVGCTEAAVKLVLSAYAEATKVA